MTTRDLLPFRRRRAPSLSLAAAAASFAAGAAAVALLDPRRGARRRGALAQRTAHAARTLEDFGGKAARDLAHRSRGVVASAASRLRRDEPAAEVLAERVRSRLGRLTSHPGAIEVAARDGAIELRGPVLEAEVSQVLQGVSRVRGVREVLDLLERHEEAGDVPALQGGTRRPRPVPDILQRSWAPSTRAIAFAGGAVLAALAARSRGAARIAFGGSGAWLVARAVTNLETRRLLGAAGRRGVDLRKSISIDAPREEVFAFFRAFENFPRFMSHVRGVSPSGEGRWHWVVDGPAGAPVEWDAEIAALVPSEVIAWRTVPGAAVRSEGAVRFDDDRKGTRIDVRLSYRPPGGALGHGLAVLLGADPKRQLDDDLLRLKSILEHGRAEGVTREELQPGQQPQQPGA